MQKEYWVNVYDPYWWLCSRPLSEQSKHETREDAIEASNLWGQFFYPTKPAYRVHVKIKEPEIRMRDAIRKAGSSILSKLPELYK